MASLFKHPKSRFWWIRYRHPQRGLVRESTRFEVGRADCLRQARALMAERTLAEQIHPTNAASCWDRWVVTFLQQRYGASPNTLHRYLIIWKTLSLFLHSAKVDRPQALRREHAYAYMEWRSQNPLRRSRPEVSQHNTHLLELLLLGLLVREAVLRKWIPSNPIERLGIKRRPARIRAEMTDAHVEIIRQALAARRQRIADGLASAAERRLTDFLHISFEIALAQGCRLKETYFALQEVDFGNLRLRFVGKGGKLLQPPLNPELVPLLQGLLQEGRTMTYELPNNPSLCWFKFLDTLRQKHPDMADVSFHSTRVRMVSRLERAGVPEHLVMKVVGHSSTTVHRIYRRVQSREFDAVWAGLKAAGHESSAPGTPGAPPATP